jgi:hypothetical protein
MSADEKAINCPSVFYDHNINNIANDISMKTYYFEIKNFSCP